MGHKPVFKGQSALASPSSDQSDPPYFNMKSKESKGASCWLDLDWTLVGTNGILSLCQPRPGLNQVELIA